VPTLDANARVTVNTGQLAKTGTVNATVSDDHGAFGVADWFAWSAKGSKAGTKAGLGAADILNVGVQTYPAAVASAFCATSQCGAFAIQTAHAWTNPAEEEFDVLVDVNNDGTPDYDVVSVDFGGLTAGSSNGEAVVAVINLTTHAASIRYLTGAMFNGTTAELQFDFNQLCQTGAPCLSPTTPITYQVFSFDRNGGSDAVDSIPAINLFNPVFSNNFEDAMGAGSTATDTTTVNAANWAATPQLGLLVIEQNNQRGGSHEAETIPLSVN
jgi:minor extracellular serine protease Vpr